MGKTAWYIGRTRVYSTPYTSGIFCHISNNNFLFFMLKQPGDHQYVWEKKTIVLEKVSKRTVMCLKSILYS